MKTNYIEVTEMRCRIKFNDEGITLSLISLDGYESEQLETVGNDGIIDIEIFTGKAAQDVRQ